MSSMTLEVRLKQMAEFMGDRIEDTPFGPCYCRLRENGTYYVIQDYHTDWNELHRVLAKVNELKTSKMMNRGEFKEILNRVGNKMIYSNISEAFAVLSDAISWLSTLYINKVENTPEPTA